MNYIIHKFKIIKAVSFVTYKEWAAYRTHSMVSILTGPIYFLVQVCIWTAVYSTKSEINGLTLEQMILYFGVSSLINYLTMDFADWNLQMLIHTGKFVTFLLRPINHRFFALSQKIGHRTLGLLYEFVPVSLLIVLIFNINIIPANVLWSIISIILSFFMMFYINYCIGITGFWLTKTGGLRGVFLLMRNVFSGALIPLTFFPEILQKILFYVPFQFVSYVPACVYIGNYNLAGNSFTAPQIVMIQAAYVLAMYLLSQALYKLGIKKFTGVGT